MKWSKDWPHTNCYVAEFEEAECSDTESEKSALQDRSLQDDDSGEEENEELPVYLCPPNQNNTVVGEWESHTKVW